MSQDCRIIGHDLVGGNPHWRAYVGFETGDGSHELQYCLPYFSSASAHARYIRPCHVTLRSHSPDIDARNGPLNWEYVRYSMYEVTAM
jgi:hypothetical protein